MDKESTDEVTVIEEAKESSTTLHIRMPASMKEKFNEKLEKRDEGQANFIRRVISAWLDGRLTIEE